MRILVGTSGFSFDAWKGSFYPEKIAPKKMLAFYAARLPTVEVNNTFYKLPTEKTLADWAAQVPVSFRFSVKASRYVTHGLRLLGARDALAHFFALAASLGDRLGPLYVQVPPFVKKDVALLADFLSALPKGKLAAMDFRDGSWRDDAVYGEMKKNDAAWVQSESDEDEAHLPDTASWSYIRLRKTSYSKRSINAWAERITSLGKDSYIYFKHEDDGLGPRLAKQLTDAILVP